LGGARRRKVVRGKEMGAGERGDWGGVCLAAAQ
jgi:hypothetical protein